MVQLGQHRKEGSGSSGTLPGNFYHKVSNPSPPKSCLFYFPHLAAVAECYSYQLPVLYSYITVQERAFIHMIMHTYSQHVMATHPQLTIGLGLQL